MQYQGNMKYQPHCNFIEYWFKTMIIFVHEFLPSCGLLYFMWLRSYRRCWHLIASLIFWIYMNVYQGTCVLCCLWHRDTASVQLCSFLPFTGLGLAGDTFPMRTFTEVTSSLVMVIYDIFYYSVGRNTVFLQYSVNECLFDILQALVVGVASQAGDTDSHL